MLWSSARFTRSAAPASLKASFKGSLSVRGHLFTSVEKVAAVRVCIRVGLRVLRVSIESINRVNELSQ